MPFYVKSYGISTRLIGRKLQKLLLSMDLQKKKNSSVTTWRDRSQLGETGIRGVAAWKANLRHIFREEEPISSCYGQIHIEIPPRLRESGRMRDLQVWMTRKRWSNRGLRIWKAEMYAFVEKCVRTFRSIWERWDAHQTKV